MLEIRGNLNRAGRTVGALCMCVQVVCFAMFCLGVVGLVLYAVGSPLARTFVIIADHSSVAQLTDDIVETGLLPIHRSVYIDFGVFIMAQVILLAFVQALRHLVLDMTSSDHPFKVETARHIRKRAWLLSLLMLWNVLAGAMLMLIAVMASYLIEYGAYLQDKADETERIQEDVIISLAEIAENKSGHTGRHVRRVAEYTRVLADELGYPEEQLDALHMASIMHDVGKLFVPAEVLEKPGRLTDEEFAVVRRHTIDGGRLLENVHGDVMQLSRTIALDHHERWDGKGYAQRRTGEDISLEGRIVAVADVYDALTSRRSYKEAWSSQDAYDEIVRGSGTQFDPRVVEAFQRRYDEIDEIRREFADD